MDKYYYLVTQLPMLFFGKETSLTIENFLDEAQKWMGITEYEMLTNINVNDFKFDQKDNPTLKDYKIFETGLRTDIALWREAQRKDVDYKPSRFPASLLKEGNPLEIELKLMEMRWNFIDEMEREHHFDIGFLILYFLKLQLLRRYFTFSKDEGLIKFQKLYEVDV